LIHHSHSEKRALHYNERIQHNEKSYLSIALVGEGGSRYSPDGLYRDLLQWGFDFVGQFLARRVDRDLDAVLHVQFLQDVP
jgi:hypothetical protein